MIGSRARCAIGACADLACVLARRRPSTTRLETLRNQPKLTETEKKEMDEVARRLRMREAPGPLAEVQLPADYKEEKTRGRQLFIAKGCFTCHARRDLDLPSIAIGPDLTGTKLSPEFLASFLANPQMTQRSGTFPMPNLHLSQGEIVALSAFLTAPALPLPAMPWRH